MPRKMKPKFRVGQVVMCFAGSTRIAPMLIEKAELHLKGQGGKEYWRYFGSHLYCWETQLRPLTKRERGQ